LAGDEHILALKGHTIIQISLSGGEPKSLYTLQWERVYGDTKVYVRTESKSDMAGTVGWTDVYFK
jgi:hypothetical protein